MANHHDVEPGWQWRTTYRRHTTKKSFCFAALKPPAIKSLKIWINPKWGMCFFLFQRRIKSRWWRVQMEIIISRGRMLLLPGQPWLHRAAVHLEFYFHPSAAEAAEAPSLACNLCQTFRDAAAAYLWETPSGALHLFNNISPSNDSSSYYIKPSSFFSLHFYYAWWWNSIFCCVAVEKWCLSTRRDAALDWWQRQMHLVFDTTFFRPPPPPLAQYVRHKIKCWLDKTHYYLYIFFSG